MRLELTRRHHHDGVDLAWDQWGPEEATGHDTPLVLCHGFSGSSHDFALHVPTLAARRPVLALDHRGHGASTKFGDPDRYRVDLLVADVVSWLDAVADGPIDLLGHSMGGRVAMRVATHRPDLVRSLILMDTTAWGFVDFGGERDAVRKMMVSWFEALGPDDTFPSEIASPEQALIVERTPPQWQEAKAEIAATFDPVAAKALGLELFDDRLEPMTDAQLAALDDVTVLVGARDQPYVEHAPRLAEAAGGKLVVIDGAYHSPQLTHPEQWLAAVTAHLDRCD